MKSSVKSAAAQPRTMRQRTDSVEARIAALRRRNQQPLLSTRISNTSADDGSAAIAATDTRNLAKASAAASTTNALYRVIAASANGISVPVGDFTALIQLWEERRVVLCFLRHFGCRFCKQLMVALNEIQPQLEKHSVTVVAIGMGTIEQAKAIQARLNFRGELYVDASHNPLDTYKLFKLKSGKEIFYGPDGKVLSSVREAGLKALADGFEDSPESDWSGPVVQAGGIFVLGSGNSCDFVYRSAYSGDHPDMNDVLAAASGQTADGKQLTYTSTQVWMDQLDTGKPHREEIAIADTSTSEHETPSGRFEISLEFAIFCTVLCVSIFLAARGRDIRIIVLVMVFGCIAAAAARFQRGKTSPGRNIILYTPKQIDNIAYEAGIIECDCGFVQYNDVTSPHKNVNTKKIYPASPSTEDSTCAALPDANTLSNSDISEFQNAVCYFREFLAKGHEHLGRNGPTCPFVPVALRKNSLFMAICRPVNGPTTKVYVESVVMHFLDRFSSLEPCSGRFQVYKAILLIFPDVPLSEAQSKIDEVQAKLKPLFVRKGLMLGEFHKHNNAPGLHNPNFYPLRTPSPCLAIRKVVPTDLAFLDMSKYSAAVRVEFLEAYLKQFDGSALQSGDLVAYKEATKALERAKNELS